jgi:hypothetical protein
MRIPLHLSQPKIHVTWLFTQVVGRRKRFASSSSPRRAKRSTD